MQIELAELILVTFSSLSDVSSRISVPGAKISFPSRIRAASLGRARRFNHARRLRVVFAQVSISDYLRCAELLLPFDRAC